VWPAGTPTSQAPELKAGKANQALIGLANVGETSFEVVSVEGSVHSPTDFSSVVQSFDAKTIARPVDGNQLGSFMYEFTPQFDGTRSLTLSLKVNYKDSNYNLVSASVFNETVTITQGSSSFDGASAAVYAIIIAGAAYALSGFKGKSKKTGSASKKAAAAATVTETGTARSGADNDFLQGTYAVSNPNTPKKKKN